MGKELTNGQKKEWAQMLFVRYDFSQKEIAQKVGVSENTLSAWVRAGKWDVMKTSLIVTKDMQLSIMYEILAGATSQLKEKKAYGDPRLADAIRKHTASIKDLETETNLGSMIETGMRFIDFVRKDDLEAAKKLTNLFDAFIQNEMR